MKKCLLIVGFILCLSSLFGQKKILFDNTKGETASNADWIIDDNQAVPSPGQSGITQTTAETYWQGALSSWGVEMVKRGYYVETLPKTGSITYNDASNSQDLSNYDIFVVCEPNNPFSTSEKKAMIDFVQNGGGLFIVSDHAVADRDGDGWDALEVWNDFFASYSNPFGFTVDTDSNVSKDPATNVANLPSNTILHGPAGDVDGLAFYNGATFTIDRNANPNAVGLVFYDGHSNTGTTGVMAACATYGKGRVVAVGDSSVPEDETAHDNSHTYPGWYQPYNAGSATGDDGVFMTNATIWLAQSTINPEPSNNVTGFSATNITSKSIRLVWTDAAGANLPSGYLIKWGTSPSISVPTDGVAVNSGIGVANVSQGVQSYTVPGLSPNTTYYFKIYPYSNSSSSIDYLTSGTPSVSAKTLEGFTVLNSEDFENCSAITWTPYDVAGDDAWVCGSGYEEMNGFGGTTDEDWLISPALNLNNYSSVVMAFTTATQYAGPALELFYSTNYDGTSNPSTQGTWTKLNFTVATTVDLTPSGSINLSGISGSAVYFAFKYKATGTTSGGAAMWRVDNILIEGSNASASGLKVQSYSPFDDATTVLPTDNLVMTFSNNVIRGTAGSVTIYSSNATVFETIPYSDDRLLFQGNTVTINPEGEFSAGTSYYVNIEGNVIADNSGNYFAGIAGDSEWNYTVQTASYIPGNGNNTAIIYPNPANESIVITLPDGVNSAIVSIVDINGKCVYNSTFDTQKPIDISKYTKGLYFVKLISKGKFFVSKLIIL
ncbi:MAG: Ig-like domain-containing protein [Bacteroidales bacterium]|nr:Ig-like domain-containing protein [Bacteroidales bacterium]